MTKTVAARPTTAQPSKKLPPIVYITSGLAIVLLLPQLGKLVPSQNPLAPKFQISAGEQAIITANLTESKKQAIQALRDRNFSLAQKRFEESLRQVPNDPEALIYLNNIKAGNNAATIAVSIPISSNLNVAQEILRGVAQAQDEINRNSITTNRSLKVMIADDANDPEQAKQVAVALVKNPDVLAVIGHNASNASIAAAPIYQQAGLLMMSPTSFSDKLSGFGNAIFRTVPNTNFLAAPLAEYVRKSIGSTKIMTCADQQAADNEAFKNAFIAAFTQQGGQIMPIACDFGAPDFNPVEVMRQATISGVQGILLTPHVDRLDKALAIAQQSQGRIPLYSSSTLYTFKTLDVGKSDIAGLVLPVLWHPQQNASSTFPQKAKQLWGRPVNWRTATAYDATHAIATGLARAQSRLDLIKTIRDPNFSATGAANVIKFLPSGDRQIAPILVSVKPTTGGYEFLPIAPASSTKSASSVKNDFEGEGDDLTNPTQP